ncbi:SNW/SKI-interacting protein A-like [Solanum stenotomum]|uniref:SNW/SKI-interacting protein A-like n=1 Tax=Solanum stenotomum TaxID=172797 RepID=UPI0020D0A04A|nr:SNW/SKI-interacting protein A-like [Solanum stenotomum]
MDTTTTTQETKEALEKIIHVERRNHVPTHSQKCIKYKSNNSQERIIKMLGMPVDPIDPPKFKHKKIPRASGSPPVPLMHSPPRSISVKDQLDWNIPPCISDWKNPKGYTIPLDRHIASNGRGLQEVHVNDNLAKFTEALNVAEEQARKAVAMRFKVQEEIMLKHKENKEMELRELASKARSDQKNAACLMNDMNYERAREDRLQRKKIFEERCSERRLEATMGGEKKRKITRDRDRDISEKLALGMASTSRGGEVMIYDQRLFNQEKGVASGFAPTDDAYNIYDRGLFTAPHQPALSILYRPNKDVDSDMYGGGADEKTDRSFKPDTAFVGTSERRGPRDTPVKFEADPFGLNQNVRKLVGISMMVQHTANKNT